MGFDLLSGSGLLIALWALWSLLAFPVLGGFSAAWLVWVLIGGIIAAVLWGSGVRLKDHLAGRSSSKGGLR